MLKTPTGLALTICFISGFSSLAPHSAFAWWGKKTPTPFEVQFHHAAERVPNNLIGQGITQIGDLDLSLLNKELETVRGSHQSFGFFMGSGGERGSALHTSGQGIIFNDLGLAGLWPETFGAIAFHESMRELKYGHRDENYELTLSLTLLQDAYRKVLSFDPKPLVTPFFEGLKKQKEQRIYKTPKGSPVRFAEGGGGSSVGGGGDGYSLEVKTVAVMLSEKWLMIRQKEGRLAGLSAEKVFVSLMKMDFETDWDVSSFSDSESVRVVMDQGRPIVWSSVVYWRSVKAQGTQSMLNWILALLDKIPEESLK